MVRHIGLVLALCCLLASGCHVGCCGKRASEKNCPTDIRKMHCWCFGEDALFRYPCGPNAPYYGHKPTCWREWPTSASQWRDIHCGPVMPPMGPCAVPGVPLMLPAGLPEQLPPAENEPAPASGELPPADAADGSAAAEAAEPEGTAAPETLVPSTEPQSEPNQLPESEGAGEAPPAAIENAPESITPPAEPSAQKAAEPVPQKPWRPVSNEVDASKLQFQSSLKLESDPKSSSTLQTSSPPMVEQRETAVEPSSVRTVQAEVEEVSASDIKIAVEPARASEQEVIIEDYDQPRKKAEPKPTAAPAAVPGWATKEDQPAAAPAINPAAVKEAQDSTPAWRPKASDVQAAGLEFHRWPTFDAAQQAPGQTQINGWTVVEQSETAARENPLRTSAAAHASSPPSTPMAIPAWHSKEVFIDDQNLGDWKKAEPKTRSKTTAVSTPDIPKRRASIQAETSAALQRFISHEKQNGARK